jgi:hypothetical protein
MKDLSLFPYVLDLLQPFEHALRFLLCDQFTQSSLKIHLFGLTSPAILPGVKAMAKVERSEQRDTDISREEAACETWFVHAPESAEAVEETQDSEGDDHNVASPWL